MNYSQFFSLLSLFAGLLSVILLIFSLKSSEGLGKKLGISLFSALSLYSFGYTLELQSFSLPVTLRIIGIEYIGITVAPVIVLLLVFRYNGVNFLTIRKFVPVLLVIPAITLVIVWTDLIIPWLYLEAWMNTGAIVPGFERIPGLWWFVITGWNICLLLICLVILGKMLLSPRSLYRSQTVLIFIGVFAPFISLFLNLYLHDLIPIDFGPFSLVITGLALFPASSHNNFLNIIPVAYATVFRTLGSGLIVLDNQSRIREINPEAEEIFQVKRSYIVGKNAITDLPYGTFLSELVLNTTKLRKEIEIVGSERSEYYLADVMPFHDEEVVQAGSVLMITRITDRKEKEEQLIEYTGIIENRNVEINKAYKELQKNQEALQESEKSLKKAQAIAHLGIYEWNISTNQTYASNEFKAIFGIDESEVLPVFLDLLRFVSREDISSVSKSFKDLISLRIPFSDEFWIERVDNSAKRAILGQGEIVEGEEEAGVITLIIQDITDRKLMEEKIHEAFLEKETLIREIHHRVKNNMQVISSLLSMQSRTIKDPAIQTIFKETQARVRSLALVHEQLYLAGNLNKINYKAYLHKMTDNLLYSYEISQTAVSCIIEVNNIEISVEKAVPCSLVISELLTNSCKHAFADGRKGEIIINFSLDHSNNQYILDYRDNGIGFPPGFNPDESSGIGSSLINGLTRQLSGNVRIDTHSTGVHYIITFPDD